MRAKPFRVTLETNPDQCNLKCVFCQVHSPHAKDDGMAATAVTRQLDFATIRRVFDELGESLEEVAASTMGEPLLYQHIDALIELCASRDVKLNLTTNGTFPHRSPRDWAVRLAHVASDVKVSLNAANAETQAATMIGSRWSRIVDNIRQFIQTRDRLAREQPSKGVCTVTLKVVFLEANLDQLPDIVTLGQELGVDRVRGHHLLPLFPEMMLQSLDRDAYSRDRWREVAELCNQRAQRADGTRLRLDNFEPFAETTSWGACPFLGEEAFVTAKGRLVPCCVPQDVLVQLGDFGDVAKQGITELWNGAPYRSFVEHPHPLCGQCSLRAENH